MSSNSQALANLRNGVQAFSLLAALLLAVSFAIAPNTGHAQAAPQDEPSAQESAVTAAETPSDIDDISAYETPEAARSGGVPVNWLPDLKVPAGAPETDVDLSNLAKKLCAQKYFGKDVKPSELEWEIVKNSKSSVADLELDCSRLRILWNAENAGKTEIVVKASVKGEPDLTASASFNAEAWLPDYSKLFMAILGGLGLFLFGMKNMTSGLTAIAGAKLRRLISFFTDNRFAAVGVGFLTTAIVQSSSATSVMALGFVDSGMMTLTQAINVIIGTNIGTTATGWLLTFKIGALGLPILGASALALVFMKNELVKHWATFLLGFGMIFYGLEVMKHGMEPLSELPEFSGFMQSIEADSLLGVGKGIVVGALATMLVQSSSVAVAIVMTLVALNTISLESAVALVLGSNIGTTITAFLASIGTGSNARRAAYFHVFFNVIGVAWVWPLFFIALIPSINALGAMCGMEENLAKVALTHTVFNVANAIVFIPFSNKIAALLNKIVKDEKVEAKREMATDLHKWVNSNPAFGLSNSRLVVQKMFLICRSLVVDLTDLQKGKFEDAEKIKSSFAVEEELDMIQDETVEFITTMTRKADSSDLASSAREQVRLAQELETISDYLTGVLKSNLKLKNENKHAVPEIIQECVKNNLETISLTLANFETQFDKHIHQHLAEPMKAQRDLGVEEVKKTRDAFQQDMFENQYDPAVIAAVDYQLNAVRRMYEHLLNIAEAMETPGKPAKTKTLAAVKPARAN